MQLSTIVLALAASASAAVAPHASDLGSWHVQLTKTAPKNDLYLTAKFTSKSYPDGLHSACIEDPSENPVYHRCDHAEFDFSYDGENVTVTQNIKLPNPMTVYGSACLPLTKDIGSNRLFNEIDVPVSKAIA